MVDKAFNVLDKDGSGVVNVQDIINVYDVSKDKEFISGKKSKEQILGEFLDSFEGAKGNRDG
jgi:Ca2+-binding EF-hand superfamily protein